MTRDQWNAMQRQAAGLRSYGLYGGQALSLAGRTAKRRRYELMVDPHGRLSAKERAKRADALQRADMLKLTLIREQKRGLTED